MKKFILLLFVLFASSTKASAQFNAQPPFDAWVAVEETRPKPDFETNWPSIAMLRYGDVVRVVECRPTCNDPEARVRLEPFGVIRISALRMLPVSPEGDLLRNVDNFTWGKIRRDTSSHLTVDNDSRSVEHFKKDDELIFRTNPSLLSQGYLQRPNGGYVRSNLVRVLTPSPFSGWQNPPDHFAFVVRNNQQLTRYQRFEVVEEYPHEIALSNGAITQRSNLRVGRWRARPDGVPEHAMWVHIDLNQQVLTAYDRNNHLVFATLVSTGKRETPTNRGIFRVRRKILHTHMRGGGEDPYSVEGVPWVLYFDGAIALHGSYWGNSFGDVRSHGCVNLSLSDAHFIYNFAPIQIPFGWRSINPITLNLETLWVVVD